MSTSVRSNGGIFGEPCRDEDSARGSIYPLPSLGPASSQAS